MFKLKLQVRKTDAREIPTLDSNREQRHHREGRRFNVLPDQRGQAVVAREE